MHYIFNLVAWRTEFDRLPSRIALARRGVQIVHTSCPLCAANVEDLNHLFLGCGHANGVWSFICKWCKIDPFFAYDCEDLLLLYKTVHGGKWRKKIIRGIVIVTIWVLWKTKNAMVFQQTKTQVREAVAEVKSFSFLWLKHRSKFKCIVWKDWVEYPLYLC